MSSVPNDPPWADMTADGEPVGWRVIDADGNVIASGPGMELEMTTQLGEGIELEVGASDGSD